MSMRIKDVVERILEYHPHLEGYKGCDDYKCGDPDGECTGVVCALTPSVHVIEKTIALGANLIVVHEPTFYTSADENGWFEDFGNEIYKEKRKLLDDHGICIWRDHDHMHANDPDSIFTGVLKYMGWQDKAQIDSDTGLFAHYLVQIDETSVEELCHKLIDTIGINGARIVGDRHARVSRIALVGHLSPGDNIIRKDGSKGEYSVKVIETLEKKADLIIPGEVIDWTTLSYVRDASQLGHIKAAICIGHFNWEELGMRYMKDRLPGLLNDEVKVDYVPSEDMYTYVVKEEKPCE